MTDRPILFSAPMVRALLAGRKTMTRRVLTRKAALDGLAVFGPEMLMKPGNRDLVRYTPGDRLWVREAFARTSVCPIVSTIDNPMVVYRAADNRTDYGGPWKPGIHLPRQDSRITLLVDEVKVERLQEISEEDAESEGLHETDLGRWHWSPTEPEQDRWLCARDAFAALWRSINGPDAWAANPYVAAIRFRVVPSNIDSLPAEAA